MTDFGFSAAREGETIVHGAQRPGYGARSVGPEPVRQWMDFMGRNGIRRVCCLLPAEQLAYYHSINLLDEYRLYFGEANVCSAAIQDYHLCSQAILSTVVLPFLIASEQAKLRVVVHCSGGIGRTGHVLASWLIRCRGLSVAEAIAAVAVTGRNPREAVECGNATDDALDQLLRGLD